MKISVLLSAMCTVIAATFLFAATVTDDDGKTKTLSILSSVFWFLAGVLIIYFLVFKDREVKPECQVKRWTEFVREISPKTIAHKMLQLQTAYSQVQKTMKQHGLPQEVIDMIFRDVYKYNNDSIFYHLSSLASIWWEPSYRLRELCGERGALQPRYYDYWKLFPAFISL